ncbi:MAG: hypothetical protein HXY40_06395 [Chloroflexi bacterium]|nr:hypothetical protein [Chloroflexota bacterium]
MSSKPEFIQLEQGDDVNALRDRLSFIRGQRVLLIWPEEGTVLTRKLDLVLLQREAMRRAIRLALVTHDPDIIKHARELNISTFETVGASERGRWKRGRTKVFLGREGRPQDEPLPAQELKAASGRLSTSQDEAESRRGGCLLRLLAVLLLVALGLGTAYVLAPSATVTIVLAQESIPVDVQITADAQATGLNVETATVPALTLRVEIEETGTVETSGVEDAADILATGSVVFINQTNRQLDIPSGTVISTSAGTPILFQTTADAVVSAGVGNQMEVPIEALPSSGGDAGNVEPGMINTVVGDLSADLTVRNIAATSGGDTREVRLVTADDRARVLANVRQQLQVRAFTAMSANLTSQQSIIIETLTIAEERPEWTTFSAQVGDTADSLTLTLRAVVTAAVIDETLARQIALARLSSQVPRGRSIQPQSVEFEVGPVLAIDPQGRVTFSVTGSALVVQQVDPALLQERLAGRTIADAQQYLLTEVDVAENTLPQIILSPDFLPTLPLLAARIEIIVQENTP